MKTQCRLIDAEQLELWADGEMTHEEGMTVEAHINLCAICTAHLAEYNAYRRAMGAFCDATDAPPLDAGFWMRFQQGLDRADAKTSLAGETGSQFRFRPRLALAGGICFVMLFAFASVRFSHPVLPLAQVLAMSASDEAQSRELETEDCDRAFAWLGQQIHADLPTVNLSLVRATLVKAVAYPTRRQGELRYRNAQGVVLALRLSLRERFATSALKTQTYQGSRYYLASLPSANVTRFAWESEGRVFVVESKLPVEQILPFVHEIDKSCRIRR